MSKAGKIFRMARKTVFVLLALAGLAAIVSGIAGQARKNNEATSVRVEEVRTGELTELVSAPGEIEPKTVVEISAKVSARIVELPYDEGDVVTKGKPNANPPAPPALLVQLDDKDLKSQLRSAEASKAAQEAELEVDRARIESQKASLDALAATLELAKRDLERKQGLFDTKDISQAAIDEVKFRVDELVAQYESSKHSLDAAEKNLIVMQHNLEAADARIEQAREALSYTTITSPIDGVITRLNAEVGEMVMTGTMNNPGTVIMEVGDLSKMLVVAQVDEADVGLLELGQRARVMVQAFPDIVFEGTVDEIALKHRLSDNRTRYYRTEILLDDDPNVRKLYTGLTADVDIETRKHSDVIKVPSQAVLAAEIDGLPLEIRDNNPVLDKSKTHATVVYRYVDGKAVATPVKIGASDLTHTIILEGLQEGQQVVVGPYKALDSLKHDQKIRDEREVEAENKSEQQSQNAAPDANEP